MCLVLLVFRPAIIFGVDGDALASSVGASEGCELQGGEEWLCQASTTDPSNFETVPVNVNVDGWGCWDGELRNAESARKIEIKSASDGCISMANVLFD